MSHGPLGGFSKLTSRYADRTWFRVAGIVITLLVFASGFTGLMMEEGKERGPLVCLYETCEFFLFHGNGASLSLQHWPHDKAPVILISIAAFGGPLLSAVVLVLLVGQISAVILDRQGVRAANHVVILGCGREGLHWAKYLHKNHKSTIVVVNRNEDGPHIGEAKAISKAVLIGDMRVQRTRERASVATAKMVVISSGNEVANIDTARAIADETSPDGPIIFCRIVSQALLFLMTEGTMASSSRIRYFNIYDIVAHDTVGLTLEAAKEKKPGGDATRLHLIICGFGRFGQAVLHAAGANSELFKRLDKVHIVDLRAKDLLDEYAFSAPEGDGAILEKTHAKPSGILSKALWTALQQDPAGAQRLVFICTDNDVNNLVNALAIQRLLDANTKPDRDVQPVVVMRQFESTMKIQGMVSATMGQSTDGEIERLIAELK
jgi:voltage-gated potassium channel Kch